MVVERTNEFADVKFHVYHKTPICPAIGLANTVKRYRDEVLVYPGDSHKNGWREILAVLPCLDLSSIEEPLRKYHDVLTEPRIVYASGEEDISYLYAKVLDSPLNFLKESKVEAFIKLFSYRATTDYEEFQVYIFPPVALNSLFEGLSQYAEDLTLFQKNLRPLKEMPRPMPLMPPTFERVLDEEDERTLRIAFQRGWFEYPRRRSGRIEDLARELGVAPSTIDVRLRSISRRLSQAYFRRNLYGR